MFVKNSFEYDARVTKEAHSLIDAGHDVTVVALHAPETTPERETTDGGIHVIRVPRSNFGVPAINRLAGRYVVTVETRHAQLTGDEIDRARVIEQSKIAPASTATPGVEADIATGPASGSGNAPTRATTTWARVTTPILRIVPKVGKWIYGVLRRLLGMQGRKLQDQAINRRMVKAGLSVGADVFHCHDLNTLAVGVECKEATLGSRLVYDSHELQTERNRMTTRERDSAIELEGSNLPDADAMIVASPSWIEWNRKLYGDVPDPSITILNVPPVTKVERSDLLRDELGIPCDTKILLYQGSIQESRGIEPAIDAVQQLDDVVLVVVGYGHHKPVLEAFVAREGLSDKVLFYGAIPNHDLIRYTASADIGLANIVNTSVSYYTSLPNKLFEYAMADIPVIGSDSPEIGRIVTEERIGEVCDPSDGDAIAAAVSTILSDPSVYEPGLAACRTRYNWAIEGRKLVDLYQLIDT